MRFGFDIVPDRPLGDVEGWWKACDDGSLDVIGIPDSPAVARELYVSATRCLSVTTNAGVMVAVSNPISRDVSVTASALGTLDECFPGRVSFGIGSGDSALWGVGRKPGKVDTVREYVTALREGLGSNHYRYRGREWSVAWGDPDERDIPILVACSGTRMLEAGAQVADGLILAMGFSDENLTHVDEVVDRATAAVGRPSDGIERWWHCSLTFGETVEDAMDRNLGVNPGWLTLGTMEGKQIPDEFRQPLLQLTADFRNIDAEYTKKGRGAYLVDRAKELGIYDWLISRAPGLWGPPSAIAERLRSYRDRGMTNWIFYGGGSDLNRSEWIAKFTGEVLPLLSEPIENGARA
jgi:5,10-methylenetetrahydromethanopterin reductase